MEYYLAIKKCNLAICDNMVEREQYYAKENSQIEK